jgi:hypothetical protein
MGFRLDAAILDRRDFASNLIDKPEAHNRNPRVDS